MKRIFSAQVNTGALHFWLFVLRVAIGIFMLTHGIPKLQKLMAGNVKFADPFGIGATPSLLLAVFAEFVCSVLLILGLATRLAVIPLIVTMLVVILHVHTADPFGKKELPLMYLLAFLGFFILGAGKYSVDYLIGGKSKRR